MDTRWFVRRSSVNTMKLSKELNIDETLVCILANRGITSAEDIKKFFNTNIEELNNPLLMKDMDKAVDNILKAVKDKKKITIYGDYDVDGVVSTYIMYKGLKDINANVNYHIPHRENEGYGMNEERIEHLKEEGTEVILTCDNGISALNQVELAKKLQMEVIITDHHDIPFIEENGDKVFKVPAADAIVNPKQNDCMYPFKKLCGAGIAFKFIQCIYKKLNIEDQSLKFIEYAAIATICDVVDLVGENRVLVKTGLEMLNSTNNRGLKALIEETGLKDKNISVYHVGFIIGPCINATGRLETAQIALQLLLSETEEEAKDLAKKLKELNVERQNMTIESVDRVIEKIEKNNFLKDKVLVVYDEETHESIAGIVAGRIKERYNLPTIIITNSQEGAKGSARSIEEYNMFEELIKCKHLFQKFGGHPMAAGLSLYKENIEVLRKELNKNCNLKDEDLIQKVRIDKQLPLRNLNFNLINELENLEPFGKGNETPLFGEKNIFVNRIMFLGKEKKILKMSCRIDNSLNKIDALSFDGFDKFKELIIKRYGENKLKQILDTSVANFYMDMVFFPNINEFNGEKSIQINVKDFRISNNM